VDLDLTVLSAERILVVGGNGAGKTTLFGVISGRIKPNSGEVIIDGKNVTNIEQSKRTGYVSSVLQDIKAGLVEEMTILENTKLAYMRTGAREILPYDIGVFRDKLSIFGMNIENRMQDHVRNLSGGEKQALSIVMATSADYKLLLLDEVTAALSQKAAEIVMSSVDKITATERKTCLIITHDTRYMNSFGDRTIEIKGAGLHELPR
jgi:putative ABC transport system ATP-binding protein